MSSSICGADCVSCSNNKKCKGCETTNGKPFGEECFISKYIIIGGKENFEELKSQLVKEINDLNVEGMAKVSQLYALCGEFVNLAYPMPNGYDIKILDDNEIYLGCQVNCEFGDDRCFGVVANMSFIFISEYGKEGQSPEIVIFKRR